MSNASRDHLSVPSNSDMDHTQFLSDPRPMAAPSVTLPRTLLEHASLHSITKPDGSANISWSAHDVVSGDTGSAYSNAISNERVQPVAEPTSTALRNQSLLDQGSLMFPESFNEEIDFGALHVDQSSFLFPFTGMNQSEHASTMGKVDSPFAADDDRSLSRSSSVLSNLSSARTQSGTISGCRQDSSETATACVNSCQSCLLSALEILRGLHISPTACLCSINEISTSVARRQPRETGSVLATNRTAVRRMSEILQCSCIFFSQVQLVFVVICDRLLAWYRAVVRHFPDDRQDACTNADTHNATDMASEQVLHQRFAVGDYLFDACLERKIRAQVIASELQQLENVVVKLEVVLQKVDPISNHKKSQSTLKIDSPGLSNVVPARLTAHLHKQLRAIKVEIGMEN